jgi:hypothetical protein
MTKRTARSYSWVIFVGACTALALWAQLGPWIPRHDILSWFVVTFFGVHALGAAWMLFKVVRHEPKLFPYIVLVFVPYAFLWYYFERAKPAKIPARLEHQS